MTNSSRRSLLIPVFVFFASQTLTPDDRYAEVPSHYENRQYGYIVTIPEGTRGYKPKPPAPNHGFFIPLAEDETSKIEIDASYNTLEYKSIRAAGTGESDWFIERCGADWQSESDPATLGRLEAIHTQVKCKGKGSGRNLVLDSVVAIRQTTADYITAVIYSVTLISTSNAKKHTDDLRVFEQVLRSFQLSEAKQ